MATIGNIDSGSGTKVWQKSVTDVNDVDEKFSNARDIGYVRLNQYRATVLGGLKKFDSSDLYKVQVQSNAKLSVSLRSVTDDSEKGLDDEETSSDNLLDFTAEGMKLEFISVDRYGREVVIGDSSASEGSKLRDNMDSLLKGEYRAKTGNYYVRVSRADDVSSNKEIQYALQVQQGTPKHDYISQEASSSDTRNKTYTKVPATTTSSTLSSSTSAAVLSAQGAASILSAGYENIASIYNKNNSLF